MVKNEIVNNVIIMMGKDLNDDQLKKLKTCLQISLYKYDVSETTTDVMCIEENDNDKYLKKFYVDLKVQGLSDKTITQYIRETNRMLTYIGKNFRNVEKDDITYYLAYLSSKDLSATTVDNARKYIKSFFSWLVYNDYLAKNPFLKIKCIRRDPVKKEILTEHDIEILRDACSSKRELALVDFLNCTGVRVSECVSLKINDVNFLSGKCNIYSNKTKTWRTVFLDAKALKHLTDYRTELSMKGIHSDYLFVSSRGKGIRKQLSKCSIEKILRDVKNKTNIERKITVHTFRKTFASRLYRKGVQPMSIAVLLGHKDFTTTAKFYVDINKNDLKNEYDRCMN